MDGGQAGDEGGVVCGISAELRQLFQRAPGLAVVLRGPSHIFEYANPSYLRLMGWSAVEKKPLADAVPELVAQGFIDVLNEVYRTGRPFEGRSIPIALPQGPGEPAAERYFDFVYQPIVGPSGEIEGIFAQGSDVTDRVRAEQGLRASEARFAGIFNQVTVGIGQVDTSGRFMLVNDRYCEIVGRSRQALMNLKLQDITHPDDLPRNLELLRTLLETGEPFVIEKRYVRPDGAPVWVSNNVALQRDDDGRPQYVTAVVVDISDAKQAETRQRLLIDELNHRVKNTLATIQSLAAQAVRSETPREGYSAFLDRLMALSRAHDVLTRQHWERAEIGELVAGAVRPFGAPAADRIKIEGPSVPVGPRKALALSMALHELATNAVKYGALSRPEGRVEISWGVAGAGSDARLSLTWRERDGPPVAEPSRRGFGSRLLKGLAHELVGSVDQEFAVDGVVCRIETRTEEAAQERG